MNKTKVAKWLVVLNTGMAIAFMMWAIAIYTQRIDWFSSAAANNSDKVKGQIEIIQDKIKTLQEAHNRAYTLWLTNKAETDEEEKDRPARRDFYRNQIVLAKTGQYNGQPVEIPFQKFTEIAGSGLMDTSKPTGREAILYKGNEPLRSIAKYGALIAETTDQIGKTKVDIGKLIDELKAEDDKIFDKDGNGLRQLIKEQEAILNAARLEREYLGTSYANLLAETTLFTKRLDALKARLKELEAAGTKTVGLR